MKQLLIAIPFFLLLSACAAKPYAGSAKCMEQADIAYQIDTRTNEMLDNECKTAKVNTPNKELENHGLVDRSLLQLIVSVLNGVFQ